MCERKHTNTLFTTNKSKVSTDINKYEHRNSMIKDKLSKMLSLQKTILQKKFQITKLKCSAE